MQRNKRTGLSLMIGVLMAVCFLASPCDTLAKDEMTDKILATVGEEKITEAYILNKKSMLSPQFSDLYDTPEGMKDLIEQAVKSSLLSQEARRLGINMKAEVAKKIKELTDTIIIQELIKEEVTSKIIVKDEDISAFYKENKEKFTRPEEVKVSLILFQVNADDIPQKKIEKKKKAEQTLQQIKAGADIEALAKELSDDEMTKQNGGKTGFFAKGQLNIAYGEVFEEKAFSLKKGELSDVFESGKGFYIIKVIDHREKREPMLQEVKKTIESQVRQKKQKESYNNYVESLKKRYPVTIH